MKNTIKITTLLYTLLVAMAGGYAGMEYQALKSAASQADINTLQQAGFTDKPQLPVFIDSTQQGIY
jgi:sensor domain CHASE-containing protein